MNIAALNTKEVLRNALPTFKSLFANVVVRFEGDQWSPLRVLDFIDTEERIWLKALNINIEFKNEVWVATVRPRHQATNAKDRVMKADSLHGICKEIAMFIAPVRN